MLSDVNGSPDKHPILTYNFISVLNLTFSLV